MRESRYILLSMLLVCLMLSCKQKEEVTVVKPMNHDSVPKLVTHDVKTLISDSGITQYRITTPVWYVYDGGEFPRWWFPEGAFLEQFDKQFKVAASVRCDTALYDVRKQLWQLDGNVRIQNVKGELILTNQLFWDQKWQEVRSDSFVHIERVDRIIEGYGFRSNQNMTKYHLNRVMAILPIDESRMGGAATDSAAVAVEESEAEPADNKTANVKAEAAVKPNAVNANKTATVKEEPKSAPSTNVVGRPAKSATVRPSAGLSRGNVVNRQAQLNNATLNAPVEVKERTNAASTKVK